MELLLSMVLKFVQFDRLSRSLIVFRALLLKYILD